MADLILYTIAKKIFHAELSLAKRLHIMPPSPTKVKQTLTYDRTLEYSFVLRNLKCPKGARVLDVGCVGAFLPFLLSILGYDTYAVDIRKFPVPCGFKFLREDIRHTTFPDKFFDKIIAVSTLEHIGIERSFGSSEDPDGDIRAMNEMRRILKANGKILVTVPYGKAMIEPSRYRIYDDSRIKRLSLNLKAETLEYYKEIEDEHGFTWWRSASHSEVRNVTGYHAVVALKLCKSQNPL